MKSTTKWFVTGAAALALATAFAGGASASPQKQAATPDLGLISSGTLTVGMTLQFKPEMYLKAGKPAGYDVELVTALAKAMGVKLKIMNLGFNGLIPGLVAKKFDLVSVGLSATPERKKAIDFSRPYVPYALILAVPVGDTTPATYPAWNDPSKTITSLAGSTDETLVKTTFSKAKSAPFPSDDAALLQVATGRANAAVIENYLLAAYSKNNPGKLKQAAFKKPLNVQYGSWAVQKGNSALVSYLNKYLCKVQGNGQLAAIYKKTEGTAIPPMPKC
ncbi:MAG: polar amino acid transport system substrate-binding protein [Gaiellales bacterium]|jgi:ABC-type amino acid transport substrate-binding protein|nr:polar amino acid transport system substrate-binding protein [Gaiellales bacterium]